MANKQPRRLRRLLIATAAVGLTAGLGAPVVFAAGDGGTITGGGGENPEEIRLKRERAWVHADELKFGTEPYEAVQAAATEAVGSAGCSVSAEAAANLALAPTWPEVSPSGEAPSPMTMSRYDDQTSLADPEGRAEGLFFNPGVGIWQLDSAGLGGEETAATAIDSASAAQKMVPYMLGKYCGAVEGGSSEASARASAWSDWHACDDGACEDVFQQLKSEGVTTDDTVERHGGAEQRECTFDGGTYDCLFVEPSKAQGQDVWISPDYGPAPVPDPFYVFTYTTGGVDYEVRYWLKGDSGADTDVSASRELGVNARSELSWEAESTLCDTTEGRGNC